MAPKDTQVLIPGTCEGFFSWQRDFEDMIKWKVLRWGDCSGLSRWTYKSGLSRFDYRRMQDATGFKDGRRGQEPRNAILETKKARKWIFPWSCWHVDFSIMKFILHFLQNCKRMDLCCFKSLTLCYTNNRKLIHFPKSKVNEKSVCLPDGTRTSEHLIALSHFWLLIV